jgi:hypothetical protein
MILELYDRNENVEVCFLSSSINNFSFKSELKDLSFDFSISKFIKLNNNIEKILEREKFSYKNINEKTNIVSNIKVNNKENERIELYLKLFDDNLNSLTFLFDLGSDWTGGGRFFIRELK